MHKKGNLTIYKQLLQNEEALESSTVEHTFMHETWYHCLQVVHSQPPGVRLLQTLTVHCLFPRLDPR